MMPRIPLRKISLLTLLLAFAAPALSQSEGSWAEGPVHDDFRISLRRPIQELAVGDHMSCDVRLEFLGKSERKMKILSDHLGEDGVEHLFRLYATDEKGITRGLGHYMNLNRGVGHHERIFKPGEVIETRVSTYLGHTTSKGSSREALPSGCYQLRVALGDEIAGWYPRDLSKIRRLMPSPLLSLTIEKERVLRVADLVWLAGHWEGGRGRNIYREVWDRPEGNSMMGMFRWTSSGRASIYEFLIFEEDEKGVRLRFRHYAPGHRPKEKDEPITLRVRKKGERHLVMENVVPDQSPREVIYRMTDENKLAVTVIQLRGGKAKQLELSFTRKK